MKPEEFRRQAYKLVDWICAYREQLGSMPVRSQAAPGEIRRLLPSVPPDAPESFEAVLRDLDAIVVPGITQVQHPMHFGWFPSNASLASVLGDFASSGLGTLGISWESCPALTEVEEVVCDWMRQLVGLSEQWQGTIHDTASTACLTAMILAREQATQYGAMAQGFGQTRQRLYVYTTEEAHSSVRKAALLAGFGEQNIFQVGMDDRFRSMDPEALKQAILTHREEGGVPAMIVASVGSTGVTAIDPVAALARYARQYKIWLHVDAAMAGSAMLLPECRSLWEGVEGADSISWNPHKWMGTILDCSLFYVRDPDHLVRVMSTNPSYLRSAADEQVTQYRDWGIPLGRRFRALKLWFHLRLDGIDAIRKRLRRDLENARWLAERVREEPFWELMAPVPLQTVCVRHWPSGLAEEELDAHTLAWVSRINQSGQAFLSPARVGKHWIVRVSIGVEATERQDVDTLWALMRRTARESAKSHKP